MLIIKLKNIYRYLTHNKGLLFSHSAEEDLNFLNMFPEPKSDIERSFFQYKCQMWRDNQAAKYAAANLAAAVLLLPFLIYYRIQSKHISFRGESRIPMTIDFFSMGLIPEDIIGTEQFMIMDDVKGALSKNDIKWLKQIPVFKYGPFFFFKIMCRLAVYSQVITEYHPGMIIASAEYSFTSSVLTAYCEKRDAEHINIMHGEKFFNLTDAFSRFTSFYVWDQHYIQVFNKLRADKTEYRINKKKGYDLAPNNTGRYTYYLQNENVEQLQIIKDSFVRMGVRYNIRLHPRYSMGNVYKVFEKDVIEDPSRVPIVDSLKNTEYVVSKYSTVLYEAFLSGRTVVIDDLSDPDLFKELRSRDLIIMSKTHLLLSSLIE